MRSLDAPPHASNWRPSLDYLKARRTDEGSLHVACPWLTPEWSPFAMHPAIVRMKSAFDRQQPLRLIQHAVNSGLLAVHVEQVGVLQCIGFQNNSSFLAFHSIGQRLQGTYPPIFPPRPSAIRSPRFTIAASSRPAVRIEIPIASANCCQVIYPIF